MLHQLFPIEKSSRNKARIHSNVFFFFLAFYSDKAPDYSVEQQPQKELFHFPLVLQKRRPQTLIIILCQCNLEENKPESFIGVGLDNDVIVRACTSKIPRVTSHGRPLTIKKENNNS